MAINFVGPDEIICEDCSGYSPGPSYSLGNFFFNVILILIILGFVFSIILSYLNYKKLSSKLPKEAS